MDISLTKDCVKQASNFGVTVYHNICTGADTSVPWGTLDWVLTFGGLAALLVFLLLFLSMAVAFARDL
jgi:hypothetical protein